MSRESLRQTARAADTVAITATVGSPAEGQIFYLGGCTDTIEVSGSATYDAAYLNTDQDGSPARTVIVQVNFTLKHATSGGYTSPPNGAIGTFTQLPGTGKTFTDSISGSASFYENVYVTEATGTITGGVATATSTSDVNWSVVGGTKPGTPLPACQAKATLTRKVRRHQRTVSRIAL
jgi:hypothetical protein